MSETITQNYHGIEITYGERDNLWRFELRGRDRSAESLAKAKEIIDRPVPKGKKAFERIKAWRKQYGEGLALGEITSIAETPRYSHAQYVWFTLNGEREKVSLFELRPSNTDNDKLAAEYNKTAQQSKELRAQLEPIWEKMPEVVLAEKEDDVC